MVVTRAVTLDVEEGGWNSGGRRGCGCRRCDERESITGWTILSPNLYREASESAVAQPRKRGRPKKRQIDILGDTDVQSTKKRRRVPAPIKSFHSAGISIDALFCPRISKIHAFWSKFLKLLVRRSISWSIISQVGQYVGQYVGNL